MSPAISTQRTSLSVILSSGCFVCSVRANSPAKQQTLNGIYNDACIHDINYCYLQKVLQWITQQSAQIWCAQHWGTHNEHHLNKINNNNDSASQKPTLLLQYCLVLTKLLNIIQSMELWCVNNFAQQRMQLNCSMDRIIESLSNINDKTILLQLSSGRQTRF